MGPDRMVRNGSDDAFVEVHFLVSTPRWRYRP
jgi:hypothetical protein